MITILRKYRAVVRSVTLWGAPWLVSLHTSVGVSGMFLIQSARGQDPAEKKVAAENGLLGYDHKKHVQKKLLEFVAPVYQGPLIEASLVQGLTVVNPDSTVAQRAAADTIASAAASSAVLDQQARLMEQIAKNQILASAGIGTPGSKSLGSAAASNAKVTAIEARVQLLRAQLESKRERIKIAGEQKALLAAAKVDAVKTLNINPLMTKSGESQNTLLNSMKENLLRFGYSSSETPDFAKKLSAITMDPDEFARIQLSLELGGTPITFSATKGAEDLGKVPLLMRHPKVTPVLTRIQGRLEKWNQESAPADFLTATQELSKWLDELEQVSNDALGTARDAAKKGTHQHQLWTLAYDYRKGLRGLLERMQLEGNTDVLRFSRGRFDPSQHQNSTLEFARFVVSSGCKIAPALPSGENAYARLQRQLLELHAYFGD